MKEIGGYFELESDNRFGHYHKDALKLNSASSCLKLLIRTFHILKIYVPDYTCSVVWKAIRDEGCECLFYKVGKDFLPQEDFKKDDYILFNNYFGVNSKLQPSGLIGPVTLEKYRKGVEIIKQSN